VIFILSNFACRIRECRKSKNLTQKEMALALGLSWRIWQDYEGGKRTPTFDGLIALAEYFNVSIAYLTGETDDPARPKIPQLITMQDGKVTKKQPLTPDIDLLKELGIEDYKFETEVDGGKIQLSFSKETPQDVVIATITACLDAMGAHKRKRQG
jgi:transcriptional regulator with XRE-family HTH domain